MEKKITESKFSDIKPLECESHMNLLPFKGLKVLDEKLGPGFVKDVFINRQSSETDPWVILAFTGNRGGISGRWSFLKKSPDLKFEEVKPPLSEIEKNKSVSNESKGFEEDNDTEESNPKIKKIETNTPFFDLIPGFSVNKNPIFYVKFRDPNFKLKDNQVKALEKICGGHFWFIPSKNTYGFMNRSNYEGNVSEYLLLGTTPDEIIKSPITPDSIIDLEQLKNEIERVKIDFIDLLGGRPLFWFENKGGLLEISINLNHWFFEKKDDTEKEFARKFVLSLVEAKTQFTSTMIDSFFNKLYIIQQELEMSYEKDK